MKIGIIYLTLAMTLAWSALLAIGILQVLQAYLAFSVFLVGFSYLTGSAAWFGKSPSGRLNPISMIILLPYLMIQYLVFRIKRSVSLPPSEIVPGLFLGPRLLPSETNLLESMYVGAILDLTAEFPESRRLLSSRSYFSLPVLDGLPPSFEQFVIATSWLQRQSCPVYVHCAQGHGRGATVVLAWLVVSGRADDLSVALTVLKRHRPRVAPTSAQFRALSRFLEARELTQSGVPRPGQSVAKDYSS